MGKKQKEELVIRQVSRRFVGECEGKGLHGQRAGWEGYSGGTLLESFVLGGAELVEAEMQ